MQEMNKFKKPFCCFHIIVRRNHITHRIENNYDDIEDIISYILLKRTMQTLMIVLQLTNIESGGVR